MAKKIDYNKWLTGAGIVVGVLIVQLIHAVRCFILTMAPQPLWPALFLNRFHQSLTN